jgi:hypothetical protein
LISPVPLSPQDQCQSEHARVATAWQLNPKSHTTQEQAWKTKKEAVKKAKKDKHRKKQTANEVFTNEIGTESQDLKGKMVLISDLGEIPLFLFRPAKNKPTAPVPSVS